MASGRISLLDIDGVLDEIRWYLSEDLGRRVDNDDALVDYLANVLERRPGERIVSEER